MDLTLILTVLDRYGLPLVAIALLILAVVWLARRLLREMEARIVRAELLVDKLTPAFDRLAEAQETTNEITQALLDDRKERR